MSSSIMHRCQFCGQITDISGSLVAFIENPHCSQCGLSASESGLKAQEDLAALFDRQMNMGATEVPENPGPPSPASSSEPSPIMYSITQHYHHSSHVARHVSERQQHQDIHSTPTTMTTNDTLMSHNIDPSSLFPTQIELFERAIPEQKSRLIQMWQICPERISAASALVQAGTLGTMEDHDMNDMALEEDGNDGEQHYAEPYMVSGYEVLAQRDYELSARKAEPTTGSPYKLASDPIYQSQRWWEHANPQPMEHQYSAFERMNQHPSYGLVPPH